MLVGLVSSVFGDTLEYSVPPGYQIVESHNYGKFAVFKKDNIYVTVVKIKDYDINFGLVHKASSSNSFYKHYMNTWWNDYSNTKTLSMFNGQFFNVTTFSKTPLSFPLRSNWNTIVTQKDPGNLRTLKIYNNNIEAQILYDYNSDYLKNSKELIVGLNPNVDKGKNIKTGRFYIGGLHTNSSTLKYLLFFIGVSNTQYNMENELYNWNILEQDIVMMDGSGSAQMRFGNLKVYGDGIPTYRRLPNIIRISKKY